MAHRANTFIDLFAGCGGLSLGLLVSGWKGLFAIEKSPDAFKTLRHNLVDRDAHNGHIPLFSWPGWLGKEPHEIRRFIDMHYRDLRRLKGTVQLVAGGPPCQGFSFAGIRNRQDPRNSLFNFHLAVVGHVQPELVLLENVRGIEIAFGTTAARKKNRGTNSQSHASRIKYGLNKQGYHVQQRLLKAADFGVPQLRPRYFTIGIRKDLFPESHSMDFFEILYSKKDDFLREHNLPVSHPVTVAQAISDLRTKGKKLVDCNDLESPAGFKEITYRHPVSNYQKLMHSHMNGDAMNSLRLVNHRPETIDRFKKILRICRNGVRLSSDDRAQLGTQKKSIMPLAHNKPSHTLTTLPDDLLHYSEPRVHTVREHARLQSFPDWFEFRGRYTTGGERRARECPRYTQVGNAIPPLLAEVLGQTMAELLRRGKIARGRKSFKGRTLSNR